MKPPFPRIFYGCDYNPEQWPREVWDEDVSLMKKAGVNIVTVPVFGWVTLEPEEGRFAFDWFDELLDLLQRNDIDVCMATATASQPAWLDQAYPDVLVTDANGVKRHHGQRHAFCPHSPNYRRLSTRLAGKLADRYKDYPGLRVWHVNNEYGTHCYCDLCARAFREWLQARYGSLAELNRRWYAAFWGHTFTDWSQVDPPYANGEMSMQSIRIDYQRFQTESLLGCYKAEADVLRSITPNLPVTTNFMGTFFNLDYHRWAPELDIVSWDSYPPLAWSPSQVAFSHAMMRGIKEGQPFMLMEQSPSQQNWMPYNRLKGPGVLRLQSYQAIAHGAETVMYFQWRRGRGAQEKLHGAFVEHGGTAENRVFKEAAEIGRELAKLGNQTLNGRVAAEVALLFSWESWWALRFSSGPNVDLDYIETCRTYFSALAELGIQCDVVSPNVDLSRYKVILAPLLYMLTEAQGEALSGLVQAGATLVAGPFTGMVNETDLVHLNGAPGPLRKTLGVFVEETDGPPPSEPNGLRWSDGPTHAASLICDRLRLEGAEAVAVYTENFFAGEPAITKHTFGLGTAYYVASIPELSGAKRIMASICDDVGVQTVLPEGAAPPDLVEVTNRDGLLYLLNYNELDVVVDCEGTFTDLLSDEEVRGRVTLGPRAVRILKAVAG